MLNNHNLKKYFINFIYVSGLLFLSLLNYFLTQALVPYFLPLNLIPIFLMAIYGFTMAPVVLFLVGIFDDILCNGHLGMYPFLYILTAYIAEDHSDSIDNRQQIIMIFCLLFVVINSLIYLY